MGILDRLIIATLPAIPRPIMRKLSSRYIAGETIEEAIARLQALHADGFLGVLDILGEDVENEAEARSVLEQYMAAASAQAAAGLDSYVSVKPTHLGLRLSAQLARELYATLLTHCAQLGQFVRVEMEDASTTDATLELFRELRAAHDNVGIVLQARLLRTPDDIEALGATPIDVRMVKGIYLEPAEIAHSDPRSIRDAYVELVEKLFQRGHTVALATHDEHMAGRCLRLAHDRGLKPERYYFEVLMGVQQPLWHRWRTAGNRVRVYVPYGPQWRPYSQRRLRRNPEVLRHVIRGIFK